MTSTSSRSCFSVSSTARSPRFGWRKCATARVPPIAEISDPAAYRRMAEHAPRSCTVSWSTPGSSADRPYYRAALLGPGRRLYAARRAQFLHQCDSARPAAAVEPPVPLDRACAPSPRAAPEPGSRHAAIVQHLRRPIRRLRHRDGGNGDAGRALRRHSAWPGAGVDHACEPRRARPRLAPRSGQRDRSRPKPASSMPPGLRADGRTRPAASSASSSCSICASPATGQAISSARWSSIICSRSLPPRRARKAAV